MSKDNKYIPSGYKPSPLGPIPEDWEVKRIGDFGKVITGNTPPTEDTDNYGDAYKFVSPADISNSKYIVATEKHLSEKGFSISRQMPKGTVLFTCIGSTIGKCAIANESLTSNQQINAIICDSKHSGEFLYYELSHRSNRIKQIAGEQAVPIINKSTFENYKILCPPFEEQKSIAKILSFWDAAIAKQTALIEQLTLRKRGLMQQLLTGKKRLKGFEGEWKEVRLGEIGVFFKGGGVPKDKITNSGNKCLTYGDLYTKYDFVISDVKSYIDDHTANESVKIRYGDICFAGSGETKEDIGKCAAYIDNEYGYAGGDIIVFRANDCNPITLSYILNSSDVIRQKSNMGQGHSVVHIYPYQLEKLLIKLPSRAEQDAIATILMESDKEIEIQKQKLAAMQEEKKGLMQVSLTGKKRIK